MKWFFGKYNYDFLFCSIQSTRTVPRTLPQTKTPATHKPDIAFGHCHIHLLRPFLCLGCAGTCDLVIDCTSLIFCVFFFFVTRNICLVCKKKDSKNHHVQELNIRACKIHVEHSTTEPLKQNSWLVFTSHLYLYYPHYSSGLCVTMHEVLGACTTNATNRF